MNIEHPSQAHQILAFQNKVLLLREVTEATIIKDDSREVPFWQGRDRK